MAVMEKIDLSKDSPRQIRAWFDAAIGQQETERARELAHALGRLTVEAIVAHALDDILALRSQMSRLRTRLRRAGTDLALEIASTLDAFDDQLDHARTVTRLELAARRREAQYSSVRDKVLNLVADAPRRPRDIAAELQCDQAQVSRALRELEERGVTRVQAPAGEPDKRAVYYGRVAAHAAAA